MKRIFSMFFSFSFLFFMVQPVFSFEVTGWWSRENKVPDTPEVMKITKERFCGIKYSIISSSSDEIKISIDNGGPTIIKRIDDDKISITTVNKTFLIYKCVSRDTNLPREEAEKLTKHP